MNDEQYAQVSKSIRMAQFKSMLGVSGIDRRGRAV